MAKRITISVPDDLHEKMREWKSALNFSNVFQNAVATMIRKKEALRCKLSEEVDLSSIVDRLKREKIEYEINIVEDGKKDGLEWSKTAHYKELQYALAWIPDENPAVDEELGDYFTQIFNKYRKRIETTGRMAQHFFSDFSKRYIDGWKQGVELFWSEVKDKL